MNTLQPINLGTFAACRVNRATAPLGLFDAYNFTALQVLGTGDYRLTHAAIKLNEEAILIISQIAQAVPNNSANIAVQIESDTQFRLRCCQQPLGSGIDANFYCVIRRWK